ncbi:hypothetical protein [Aurantiacibacter sp. D1-12]|uniref:hypothetical protein n=1 Tax=Aurantiacibacter sp. D1-12 TaxID=2993658 RepID=UPI00237C8509|nr:hypothetical protein [Aurantiacibacter sp. D1-12]MDE1466462.1 hypothetical protein [Aurantiacibacter sp. D1-12]
MDQSGIHIGDVRGLLHKVLNDWHFEERKAVRDRLRDYEDRLEKLDYRADQAGTQDMKARLQEQYDRFKSRVDARYEMFDEAHKQMTQYVDRRAAD